MTSASWKVVVEAEGKNDDGRNDGSLIVYLRPGYDRNNETSNKQEFSRVAFVRRNSKNPHNSLGQQLKIEVGRAREATDALNASTAGMLS